MVIGDTHLRDNEQIPKLMLAEIQKADWLIHLGDYVSMSLIIELKKLKNERFLGVYGNADPLSIRNLLPAMDELNINGKKICFTHPFEGGASEITERQVLSTLKRRKPDIILYGHTHDAVNSVREGILIINPGKGYLENTSFGGPTSFAILEIDKNIRAQIITIQE